MARNYPILPDGHPAAARQAARSDSDDATWAREPFLFFVDADGKPVRQTTAGSYAEIGDFEHDDAPAVPIARRSGAIAAAPRRTPLPALLVIQRVGETSVTGGLVVVPLALVKQQAEPEQLKLFAAVTVNLSWQRHDNFEVSLNRADAAPPIFVATLLTFRHHVKPGLITFLVPLSAALATLQATEKFVADPTLNLQVVPRPKRPGMAAMTTPGESEVTAISIVQL